MGTDKIAQAFLMSRRGSQVPSQAPTGIRLSSRVPMVPPAPPAPVVPQIDEGAWVLKFNNLTSGLYATAVKKSLPPQVNDTIHALATKTYRELSAALSVGDAISSQSLYESLGTDGQKIIDEASKSA